MTSFDLESSEPAGQTWGSFQMGNLTLRGEGICKRLGCLYITELASSRSVVLHGADSALQGTSWQCLGTFLVVTVLERMSQAFREWRSGMLLNSLQCTGWPHNKCLTLPRSRDSSRDFPPQSCAFLLQGSSLLLSAASTWFWWKTKPTCQSCLTEVTCGGEYNNFEVFFSI